MPENEDELVERMATALRDEIAFPGPNPGEWVLDEGFRDEAYFREIARTVLSAVRKAMVDSK